MKLNHKINPIKGTKGQLKLIEHKITQSALYFQAYQSYIFWEKLVGGKPYISAKKLLKYLQGVL